MSEEPHPTRVIDNFPPCPFAEFLEFMQQTNSTEWVWSYIEMTSRFGVFHADKDNVILARPVDSRISTKHLCRFDDLDPNHWLNKSGLTAKHDTWHILYASGDPRYFFALCPYPLPYVAWHRRKGSGKLRRYPFGAIKSRFTIP